LDDKNSLNWKRTMNEMKVGKKRIEENWIRSINQNVDVTLIYFNHQILKYDCTLTHQCISVFQLKNVGLCFL
jgi:hypothetical protein